MKKITEFSPEDFAEMYRKAGLKANRDFYMRGGCCCPYGVIMHTTDGPKINSPEEGSVADLVAERGIEVNWDFIAGFDDCLLAEGQKSMIWDKPAYRHGVAVAQHLIEQKLTWRDA